MSQRCNKCGITKPDTEFHKGPSQNGLQYRCKPCAIALAVQWRKDHPERAKATTDRYREAHPERIRNTAMRRNYGITLDKRNQMEAAQGGMCALCKGPYAGRLHVDHCHQTGKIRGLLCKPCNSGLGQFKDDPALLRAAAEYLERDKLC